jgi:hypothetical protein
LNAERIEQWHGLFDGMLNDIQPQYSEATIRPAEMSLSQLEWVGDLLWHTMRFDAPMFPSPEDFAFQLSICGGTPCVSRIPLGIVTAAFPKQEKRNSCTRAMFRHYDGYLAQRIRNKGEPSFYEQIAKLIWQRTLERSRHDTGPQPTRSEVEETVLSCVSDKGQRLAKPMAITSNLDNEIERNLETAQVPFYVLFPVTYREPQKNEQDDNPAWMLREELPGKKARSYYISRSVPFASIAAKLNRLRGGTDPPEIAGCLAGPLVVKLRGSPVHDLPGSNDFIQILETEKNEGINRSQEHEVDGIDNDAIFNHRILLSTVDFCREIWSNEGLPQLVKDLLRESDRNLCYLGFPLDDPDGLLGLQPHIWITNSHSVLDTEGLLDSQGQSLDKKARQTKVKKTRIGVGCLRNDGLGPAILKELQISVLPIALDEVAKEIKKVPGLLGPESEKRK